MVIKTNAMEQGTFSKAHSSSASQETFPHFTETDSSLIHLQQPDTFLYPEPVQSSSHPPNRFDIHFNLILPSTHTDHEQLKHLL